MAQRQRDLVIQIDSSSLATLADLLWSEREGLDELLCKVVVGNLVTHAVSPSAGALDGELAAVIERLRLTEVLRAAEVEEVARTSRLPLDITLGRLAEVAPEPWSTVLSDHHAALRALLTDLEGYTELRQLSLHEFLD
jgi:hypothetical protein